MEIRGAGQATRQINPILAASVEGPQRLIVVEVLAPGGNWSSYPPHKHDEWSETEVPVEEIYYFEIRDDADPVPVSGLHRTYTDRRRDRRDGRSPQRRRVPGPAGLPRPLRGGPGLRHVLPERDGRTRSRAPLDDHHRPCLRLALGGMEDRSPDPRVPLYR